MEHSGHLVIIGGGHRPLCVMEKIVELAGGKDSRIVIIPIASEAPLEVAELQKLEFLALGVSHVDIIHCARQDADQEGHLKAVMQATGIFFSGGDQRKLTAALLGTRLLDEIRGVYIRGGVIAGTSAGAAVMSRVMITGEEYPLESGKEDSSAVARFIETATGFGFIDRAIIDQHFVKRGRHYRLHNLAKRFPELLGIGIDEATAIIVAPDGTFTTLGDSDVLVFHPSNGSVDHSQEVSQPPTVHVLPSGKRYCLHRQLVLH